MRLMTLVEHGIRDVRYATRTLARDRGFTAVVVATLALGLGANTAIFAVLYNAVLRPLPYERPESLMHVRRFTTSDQRGARPIPFSYSDYLDLSRDARAFEAVAAYARRVLTLSGRAHPEQITAEIVSPSYLPLLGIQPALGRAFTAGDDRTGAAPVAITSHALWQSRFGARADTLGGPIRLNGTTFTIVGVAPRGFMGDSGRADVWLTAAAARDALRSESLFEIIARRRPSATSAEADSEVRAFVARLARSNSGTSDGTAVPLAATRRDPQLGSVLAVLCGAVSFIV